MQLRGALLMTALVAATSAAGEEPKRLAFDVDFAFANINDNSLRWSLGREREMKIAYALVGLSGELNPHLSYRVELNGANESVKPEPFTPSDKTPFFFPNRADPAYGVSSRPEGQFKVDDYKNTGWDPYIQEAHLRRAFIDAHTADRRFGLMAGRFYVPFGLPLDEARWFTVKDLTHIQAIDAQVDSGVSVYYAFGREDGFRGRGELAAISGNGNPYHDYVYFDFTRASAEDTNSAVGGVGTLRLWPIEGLEAVGSVAFNYVGSRIEADTTLQRSKHYDNKLIVGLRYRPSWFRHVQVFGEYAHYKWGLRDTSAELLAGVETTTPIFKNGYYAGFDLGVPLPKQRGTLGLVVTREELDRDDSLIAFLADRNRLDVTLGKKERGTIVKLYAELGPLTVFFFHNDVDNPFPQASAIVPISGPFAFQGPGSGKTGGGFRLKASF